MTPVVPAPPAPSRRRSLTSALRTLLLALAAPALAYYLLRATGVAEVPALLLTTLPPALGALVTAVRERRVDTVSGAVVIASLLGVVALLLGGGARELLVRGAWLSAPLGLWAFASLWMPGRPVTFEVTRGVLPHRAELMDRLWDDDPRFRAVWRAVTACWGVAGVVDAALRVLMAYTLPVDVVPALDTAMSVVTVVALQVPTHLLLHRSGHWPALFARRRAESAAWQART